MARAPRPLARNHPPLNPWNIEHPDFVAQKDDWIKMEDLYLGSDQVKAKETDYLPTTESEETELKSLGRGSNRKSVYSRRLQNAVYFNGVDRLVKYAIGHMFSTKPAFSEGPEWWKAMQKDCDLLGTTLTAFLRDISAKAYFMGHYFVLADFPVTTGIDSKAVQKIVNPRPYLVPVHPMEIINWSISRSLDGTYQFDWVVRRWIMFESESPVEAHDKVVYYKVYYKNRWELYKVIDNTGDANLNALEPTMVSNGTNDLGFVPITPIYSQMIRPMVSKSPLLEAGNLNIDHYRTYSAFLHGLYHHLSPMFVTTGTQETEIKRGANSALQLPRGGTAEYVETQGHGLKIGLEAADMIAHEMWEAGMRSNAAVGANTSSDARKLARSDFFSFLESVVDLFQNGWSKVVDISGAWAKEKVAAENDLPVQLTKDFDVSTLDANQSEFLLNARKAGEISKKLFLTELKRGQTLRHDLDIDAELTEAAKDLESDLAMLAAAEAAANPEPTPRAPARAPSPAAP